MTHAPLTLSVSRSLDACAGQWTCFESEAEGTLYQSYLWCLAWLDTAGRHLPITPVIVTATAADGQIQFMLPLQSRKHLGIRILEWLGAPHGNYGHGLFRPGFLAQAPEWFAANWQHVVDLAGPVDVVALRDMPDQLKGAASPMAGLFNARGANRSYALNLSPDFDALYKRKRDGEDRRSARKKEAALAHSGAIEFVLPATVAEIHEALDTMFAQQEGRLAELGVHGVFGPDERAFIHRIAELQDLAAPLLAPYTLKLDGKPLAILLGGLFNNTYWALISSLAAGPHRKYSPGDMALRHTIEACCARGLTTLDFSSGDSRYKQSWSDDVIQLHCIIGARNLRGMIYAAAIATRQIIKRTIKESPAVMHFLMETRRRLRGRAPVTPTSS